MQMLNSFSLPSSSMIETIKQQLALNVFAERGFRKTQDKALIFTTIRQAMLFHQGHFQINDSWK